jgi:dolichol-phosphate mannosyltransferase
MLQDGTRDTGCGLKAFRREAFLELPFFNHMHRYLPALFKRDGWQIAHVDVSHRARGAGRSNYSNLQRALVGAVDLVGVAWLLRRRKTAHVVADDAK